MSLVFTLALVLSFAVPAALTASAVRLLRKARRRRGAVAEEKKEPKPAAPKEPEAAPAASGKAPEESVSPAERAALNRYASAVEAGIRESFWDKGTELRIEGKAIADRCVREGGLSYLEYENRELAGDSFRGFNLVVEDGDRMVLTYLGRAVASITTVERKAAAVVNGHEAEVTETVHRVNVFPPSGGKGVTTEDLSRMLAAGDLVRSCGGDPETVADAMVTLFTGRGNVVALRAAVDRKIQAKESLRKGTGDRKPRRSPIRL